MYLLPQPRQAVWRQGAFCLRYNTEIVIDVSVSPADSAPLYGYAKLLQKEIASDTGLFLPIRKGPVEQNGDGILLKMCAGLQDTEEAYLLKISETQVTLEAPATAGILYGVQTLRQIARQAGAVWPCVEISDAPGIARRGLCYDVTRGRVPTLAELKRQADTCSFYKINQLQLYVEHSYMFRGFSEVWRDNTPLTAEDILELDDYCRKLHIDLVPSLASFGHLYEVLRTKTYASLCELENSDGEAFSLVGRMAHHTVDVSNEESFSMVAGRINEFMALFSSPYFNICGDETFDLCKGRSRSLGEKKGVRRVYLDFLKKLCNFIVEKGKIPMYWGDVLLEEPGLLSEMPGEAVCLNWEYLPQVTEEKVKLLTEAGVKNLYLCPGVQNWNHMINRHSDAYRNISLMCRNAHKYHAQGVLNTQWGDLGHVAHPEFSTIGQIYGAAFSWSDSQMSENEINRAISVLQYGDPKEEIVSLFRDLADTECVNWWHAVQYKEDQEGKLKNPKDQGLKRIIFAGSDDTVNEERIEELLKRNGELIDRLYQKTAEVFADKRQDVCAYILMGEGQRLLTLTGRALYVSDISRNCTKRETSCREKEQNSGSGCLAWNQNRQVFCSKEELAVQLERWLTEYQKLWRSVSKESELSRILDIICWYADRLRKSG